MALSTGSVVCEEVNIERGRYGVAQITEVRIQYRALLGPSSSLEISDNYGINDIGYQVAKQFVADCENRNPNVAEDSASGKIRKITFAKEE